MRGVVLPSIEVQIAGGDQEIVDPAGVRFTNPVLVTNEPGDSRMWAGTPIGQAVVRREGDQLVAEVEFNVASGIDPLGPRYSLVGGFRIERLIRDKVGMRAVESTLYFAFPTAEPAVEGHPPLELIE